MYKDFSRGNTPRPSRSPSPASSVPRRAFNTQFPTNGYVEKGLNPEIARAVYAAMLGDNLVAPEQVGR